MKCIYCHKETNSISHWHKSCLKEFFGADELPKFDFDYLEAATNEIKSSNSVTGVQMKFSPSSLLNIINNDDKTTYRYSDSYIIKINTKEYPYIAELEFLTMTLAKIYGINTPGFALIKNKDKEYIYIIKRFDRRNNEKIHVEDFAQLSNYPTENKYHSSYEKVASIIDKYDMESSKAVDKYQLFIRLLFCFVSLNSDMHLKNFSLIEDGNKIYLSPQYDLLAVQLIFNDQEETALTINGKKRNLSRGDFIKYGNFIGINKPERIVDNLLKYEDKFIKEIKESLIPDEAKEKFIKLMKERFSRLKNN